MKEPSKKVFYYSEFKLVILDDLYSSELKSNQKTVWFHQNQCQKCMGFFFEFCCHFTKHELVPLSWENHKVFNEI